MRNAGDAQQVEVGWWPGDARYPRPAFFGFAAPAPDTFARAPLGVPGARWEPELGEYLLDWRDVVASADPYATALAFARAVTVHACTVCDWDPVVTGSVRGDPPPVH